jgi:hypothetical protein
MKRISISAIALALSACATAPDRIAPTQIDARQFAAYGCAELQDKAQATEIELQRYLTSQHKARIGDAVTWPIPMSRVLGKNDRNVRAIAQYRGELSAIETARSEKGCVA